MSSSIGHTEKSRRRSSRGCVGRPATTAFSRMRATRSTNADGSMAQICLTVQMGSIRLMSTS